MNLQFEQFRYAVGFCWESSSTSVLRMYTSRWNMAVRVAVEVMLPPDIHLMNGEAVGVETAVGKWRGSWCRDSSRSCAASAGVLWCCDWVVWLHCCSEEGSGDHATSYWTLVREGHGLAFDNRNNGLVFTAPCSWPHLWHSTCVATAPLFSVTHPHLVLWALTMGSAAMAAVLGSHFRIHSRVVVSRQSRVSSDLQSYSNSSRVDLHWSQARAAWVPQKKCTLDQRFWIKGGERWEEMCLLFNFQYFHVESSTWSHVVGVPMDFNIQPLTKKCCWISYTWNNTQRCTGSVIIRVSAIFRWLKIYGSWKVKCDCQSWWKSHKKCLG